MDDYHKELFGADKTHEQDVKELDAVPFWTFINDGKGDVWLKRPDTFTRQMPWVKVTGEWPYRCSSSEAVPKPSRSMSDSEAAAVLTSDDLRMLDEIFSYTVEYATTSETD